MDDGYLEQFPIGAINHIGLPESTLPKEVRPMAFPCGDWFSLSRSAVFSARTGNKAAMRI